MRRGANGAPSRAMCLRSLALAALVLMLTAVSTIAPALAGGVEVEPVDADALIADCQSAPDPIACLQDQAMEQYRAVADLLLALEVRDGKDSTAQRQHWDDVLLKAERSPICDGNCEAVLVDLVAERNLYQDMPRQADAEALIAACDRINDGMLASGVTAYMRWGGWRINRCLEYIALDQLAFLWPPDPSTGYMTRATARELLDKVAAISDLYWEIYNFHAGCVSPGCGTLYHVFHHPRHKQVLAGLIRDVVWVRHEYGL